MKITQYLPLEAIIPRLGGKSKFDVLKEMVDAMLELGYISDASEAEREILSREAKMTTGIGHGIAVPHARTKTADKLRVVLARHPEGLDWGSVDGKPIHFAVLLVSPPEGHGPHLQFLAAIARLLSDEDTQRKLLAVHTAKGILNALSTG